MEFPDGKNGNWNRIDIKFFVKNQIEIESRGKNQNRHITNNFHLINFAYVHVINFATYLLT